MFAGATGQFAEDHASGAVLQNAGDCDTDVSAGQSGGVFADDHSAIIEVSDTLAGSITFANDANVEAFAGDVAGFEGIGDVVEIDDGNSLDAGDFIEVEVIGDYAAAHLLGECHNFLVDGHHAIFVS